MILVFYCIRTLIHQHFNNTLVVKNENYSPLNKRNKTEGYRIEGFSCVIVLYIYCYSLQNIEILFIFSLCCRLFSVYSYVMHKWIFLSHMLYHFNISDGKKKLRMYFSRKKMFRVCFHFNVAFNFCQLLWFTLLLHDNYKIIIYPNSFLFSLQESVTW